MYISYKCILRETDTQRDGRREKRTLIGCTVHRLFIFCMFQESIASSTLAIGRTKGRIRYETQYTKTAALATSLHPTGGQESSTTENH